jgi:hypothetical protein
LPEVICNTSPIQYLHQLDLLNLLPALVGSVTVPPAVVEELSEGQRLGVNLPNPLSLSWIIVRSPVSAPALRLITDLGPGESEVLALALETPNSVVILDDDLARRTAEMSGIRLTGTLGMLLDAKQAGLLEEIAPLLERLQALGFRLSQGTKAAVLRIAGEAP